MPGKRAKPIVILLGILSVGTLLAMAPLATADQPYPLGVVLGLSGTGAPYSREALEGIRLAVDEINAQGGFLSRHPIQLFAKDSRTQPRAAVEAAQELIAQKGVRAIIGTYSSACALAIKPVCRNAKVLHIATISNSEDITKTDFSPFTFSVVPNTYMMAKGVALGIAKIARDKQWTRYVTIASDYAWGRSSQRIQVEMLKQAAPFLTLAEAYWPRLGENRFNSFIVDILAKKPDFVLSTIGGADNALWLRDARDYRLFKQVARPGGLISISELIVQAKSIRRGLYGRCRAPFFAHSEVLMMERFVQNYREKYGRYPTDWAVMSYDGVYALKQGIEKAGSLEVQKVREALSGLTIDTTRGRLTFRKIDNQLNCSAYFGRVADNPKYPFPIYHDLMELKGPDIWRPEAEIASARTQ